MSRYNLRSNQPDSGNLLTVDINVVDKGNETFIVMRYLNQHGKLIRLETETIRK